ncbi:hypothetical protein CBC_A1635 [Clostridium botulinum C str. Eklund]|nr:hypothetical protein CBC_A1635 [Clostridium botulinum C str. Eklund]
MEVTHKDKHRSNELWRKFLEGKISITCDNEQYNNYFLNCCSQQRITWRDGVEAKRRNSWTITKYNPYYFMDGGRLTVSHCKSHPSEVIVNYREIFDNTINALSQFTNEELLEELKTRMEQQ